MAGLTVQANAAGGAVGVELAWLATFDSVSATGYTFPTFTTPSNDPGYLLDVNAVSFNNTADLVSGFSLSLQRARGFLDYFDRPVAYHHSGVSTGIETGSLSISQSPTATTVPSSGSIIQIGGTGAGVQFATAMSLDNYQRNFIPGIGSQANSYSLVDLTGAGNICLITAM